MSKNRMMCKIPFEIYIFILEFGYVLKIKHARFNAFLRSCYFGVSSLKHFVREYIRTYTNFPEQIFVIC